MRRPVADDPHGGVQQRVTKPFGFGGGELAGQADQLGPGEEVVGNQRELEPGLFVLEVMVQEVAHPGVLAVADEKSQMQGLDCTAPVLPSCPAPPERATHDYKRPGTRVCMRLDITSGKVIGSLHSRDRAIEFKKFLQRLDRDVPRSLDVHLILDNSSTHKTPAIQKWLAAHPRFVLHFTPTSSSWLNLVEQWFAELPNKLLRRGTDRTVRQLNAGIRTWTAT